MSTKISVTAIPNFQKSAVVGKISVKSGDEINVDDVILTLEGKKGSMDVKSTVAGTVIAVNVSEGDTVEMGTALIEVEEKKNEVLKSVFAQTLPNFQKTAKIGKINVKVGDDFKADDVLISIEGKKGAFEVKAKYEGTVKEILIEEGEEIGLGAELLRFSTSLIENEENSADENEKQAIKYHGEVVVLGGGPGGYVAAVRASQRNKKTILIECDKLGGTCLNRGCIPTKSMVQSTRVLDTIKEADIFGMMGAECQIDMEKIMDRKNEVVSTLVGGLDASMENHSITVLRGKGSIKDAKTISVDLGDKQALVSFDDLILASGSVVAFPPFEGAKLPTNLTSDELLELREIPKSMIILGGRVIAMEFAFIYRKLGCDVTVIQRSKSIFPNMDDDVIAEVRQSAIDCGIHLYEGAAVKSIKDTADGKKIVQFEQNGELKYLTAEKLAVATGRKPNLDGLELEKLGVKLSDKTKGIEVDSHMRTTAEHIYAIGDCTNLCNLAHVASHQALVAVENIIGNDEEMKYNAIPEAVFTSPEIGICGKTEKECKKENIDVLVGKFPYMSNGKALVENATNGFIKVIAEKDSRKIIGAALVGISAADLMSTFANLITIGATIDEAKKVIYAHPTVSETLMEAVMDLDNESIHK